LSDLQEEKVRQGFVKFSDFPPDIYYDRASLKAISIQARRTFKTTTAVMLALDMEGGVLIENSINTARYIFKAYPELAKNHVKVCSDTIEQDWRRYQSLILDDADGYASHALAILDQVQDQPIKIRILTSRFEGELIDRLTQDPSWTLYR
jgi:hypothetical protein